MTTYEITSTREGGHVTHAIIGTYAEKEKAKRTVGALFDGYFEKNEYGLAVIKGLVKVTIKFEVKERAKK